MKVSDEMGELARTTVEKTMKENALDGALVFVWRKSDDMCGMHVTTEGMGIDTLICVVVDLLSTIRRKLAAPAQAKMQH